MKIYTLFSLASMTLYMYVYTCIPRMWCRQYIESYARKLLSKSVTAGLQKELDVSRGGILQRERENVGSMEG